MDLVPFLRCLLAHHTDIDIQRRRTRPLPLPRPSHGSIIARYLGSSRTHPPAAIQSFSTFVPGASPNPTRHGTMYHCKYTFPTPGNMPLSLINQCATVTHTSGQDSPTLSRPPLSQQMVPLGGTLVLGWVPHKVRSTCSLRQRAPGCSGHLQGYAARRPMESDLPAWMDQTKAKVLPLPPDCSA